MKKSCLVWIALCAVCVPAVMAGQLEDVVAKHLEARGGLDKIRGVTSAKVTGKMSFGGGAIEAPFTMKWKSPNKLRVEFTFQGMTGIQAFDGESGWSLMPFQGKTDPEPMGEDELKQTEEQADFHGPFIDTEKKGYKIEYLGKEEIDGTNAHKLEVTNKHGEQTRTYLDAEYFLEIKSEGKRTRRELEFEFEVDQGDYKEVDGLMLAHSVESKTKGQPAGQTVTLEKIELNPEIADSEFEMPAPAKSAEATEKD